MLEYLSPAWIEALDEAARGDAELTEACGPDGLRLRQEITGTSRGDVAYTVTLTNDGARVVENDTATPDVTMRQTFDVAAAIYRGELHALDAVQHGGVKLHGDASLLRAHDAALRAFQKATASVRAATTPPGP